MKRAFIIFATILLAFCLVGCGTYTPPVDPVNPGGNQPVDPPPVDSDEPNKPTEPEETTFTVRLVERSSESSEELPFAPTVPMTVKWTNGASIVTADFNAEGYAETKGLDGSYRVTLGNLPSGYTYNANIYTATNKNPDVTIALYKLERIRNSGSDLYANSIKITIPQNASQGAYRAFRTTIKRKDQVIFFSFAPEKFGSYTIESVMDTTANEVNPKLDVYISHAQYAQFDHTQDGGGASSTYTKNFKHETNFAQDEVTANGGGVFKFGVKVDTRNAEYPCEVDFILTYNGEYIEERPVADIVLPPDNLTPTQDFSGFRFVYAYADNGNLLDASHWRLNPATGYYQYYDEGTGEFGRVLFAKISAACEVLDAPFTEVEYAGNKNLTFGGKNYKLFIEGYEGIASHEGEFPGISHQYRDYEGVKGIQQYCNSDGVYPVTQEIKDFLFGYSVNQRMFFDGNGWAEGHGLNSLEEDQWLFACGYYSN